ncbi:uncharacterized protein PHALS_03871 [Plasmopara halstedii]|uniref:Uncharacterized protein n=1 Tax=Plasmopara halstedii TaxID=4781 RepID=A0A0P1AZH5_PLAHL|nr:uncharacterized protein PHALS_03871 [Plasmopara halstedii]CEG47223.1 hypothetical protein PHALS_03871 [Plasmopara halstedii]|eukprot:XP_024583592.1 hypothetical protein PHALS_03871 [Plasmopara halstedii]
MHLALDVPLRRPINIYLHRQQVLTASKCFRPEIVEPLQGLKKKKNVSKGDVPHCLTAPLEKVVLKQRPPLLCRGATQSFYDHQTEMLV